MNQPDLLLQLGVGWRVYMLCTISYVLHQLTVTEFGTCSSWVLQQYFCLPLLARGLLRENWSLWLNPAATSSHWFQIRTYSEIKGWCLRFTASNMEGYLAVITRPCPIHPLSRLSHWLACYCLHGMQTGFPTSLKLNAALRSLTDFLQSRPSKHHNQFRLTTPELQR